MIIGASLCSCLRGSLGCLTAMNKSLMPALMFCCCVLLAGCGGGPRVVQNNNETCGKQMTDLQDALNSGAMTQHEYDKARRVALKHCDTR